jgi:hypothetical protein
MEIFLAPTSAVSWEGTGGKNRGGVTGPVGRYHDRRDRPMRVVRCALDGTLRSLVTGLLVLMGSLCASHVDAQSAPLPTRWEIAMEGRFGLPRGYVKVGEHDISGTRLHLHDDLGIDLSKAAELQVGYHLPTQDTLRFSFLTLFLDGSTTLPHDVLFNGSTLLGGTRLDTSPEFYRVTLAYERTLLPLPAGGTLSGSVGLTLRF